MKTKFFLGIFMLIQLIISCKPDPITDAKISTDLSDVQYSTFQDNTLDLYLPANRNGNTRTIILIHGDNWASGDKSDLTSFAKFFRDQGFACATMNYRLTDTHRHPAQINDVAKVIDYMAAKAVDFHISPTRFGLMGVTEGAHIALLYTYAANSNKKVKTVVSMSGATDLLDTTDLSPAILPYIGALVGSNLAGAYQQASPVVHINALSRPAFIVHGKQDNVVLYQQSADLKARLDQFGIKNELRIYDNTGHKFIDPITLNALLPDIAIWFEETLR